MTGKQRSQSTTKKGNGMDPDRAARSFHSTGIYVSVGPALTRFVLDPIEATLSPRETVWLPEAVQYACPDENRGFLYVASSDGAQGGGPRGERHFLSSFRIEPGTGVLSASGEPVRLPERPIHLSTDRRSNYALLAFNDPAAVRVYRIEADGALAKEVPQTALIDPGIFPHQVLATPDNCRVILTARGNDATADRAEDPGRLTIFDFENGLLQPASVIAPNDGFGFGPRGLDFHPNRRWAYVSLERQNEIAMLDLSDNVSSPIRFRKTTLSDPQRRQGRQIAGAVHVHPMGHVIYVANRASAKTSIDGREILVGGENSLAVFAIDPDSGEPHLIQSIDTDGIHPRTFHVDPAGQWLIAAHTMAGTIRHGEGFRDIPARLTLFRIAEDGSLTRVGHRDVDIGRHSMFWMGMVRC
jgi:6-phosphogluconolactonase